MSAKLRKTSLVYIGRQGSSEHHGQVKSLSLFHVISFTPLQLHIELHLNKTEKVGSPKESPMMLGIDGLRRSGDQLQPQLVSNLWGLRNAHLSIQPIRH